LEQICTSPGLKTRGHLVLEERWRYTATKWQGHVVLLHCEFQFFTAIAVTIRPVEIYEVFRPKNSFIASLFSPSLKYSVPPRRLV